MINTGEKLVMKRMSLLVSLKCNLKCKLCVVGSPYYSDQPFVSLNELCNHISRYFSIVDFVEVLTISGGEPLLYNHLSSLLEELLKHSDKFGHIEIITNGTIVPGKELIETIKKYGNKFLRFIVDDYGKELCKNAMNIVSTLEENHIPYRLNDYCSENLRFGGWVDHGPMTEIVHTKKEALSLFAKCAQPQKMGFCFLFLDGCLYPCSVVMRRAKLGQAVAQSDYVDLNDTSISPEVQRQKIRDIYSAKCLESCEYCAYALSDDAPRFKPAEQFTARELQEIKKAL